MPEKIELSRPHILFCEGKDEKLLLTRYLDYLLKSAVISDCIEAHAFEGINHLGDALKQLLRMPNASMIRSILVLRDAERDANASLQSVRSALEKNGLPVAERPGTFTESDGVRVAYLLFPACDDGPQRPGAMEDFCLDILDENKVQVPVLKEVDRFIEKMTTDYGMKYPRVFKNRLHLFINAYDKYVSMTVGQAASAGMFDWNHPRLKMLRNLLTEQNAMT